MSTRTRAYLATCVASVLGVVAGAIVALATLHITGTATNPAVVFATGALLAVGFRQLAVAAATRVTSVAWGQPAAAGPRSDNAHYVRSSWPEPMVDAPFPTRGEVFGIAVALGLAASLSAVLLAWEFLGQVFAATWFLLWSSWSGLTVWVFGG